MLIMDFRRTWQAHEVVYAKYYRLLSRKESAEYSVEGLLKAEREIVQLAKQAHRDMLNFFLSGLDDSLNQRCHDRNSNSTRTYWHKLVLWQISYIAIRVGDSAVPGPKLAIRTTYMVGEELRPVGDRALGKANLATEARVASFI